MAGSLPFRSGLGLETVGLNSRTLGLLGNTVGLAALVAIIAGVIGSGLAVWLVAGRGFGRGWATLLFVFPVLMPAYVYALVWASVLGRQSTINTLLDGVAGFRLASFGLFPTALTLSLTLFPIVTLTSLAAARSLDPGLIEAGRVAAPDPMVWRRVVIPQLAPAAGLGSVLVFALALVAYGVPALFQFNVYSMEVVADFSQHGDPVAAFGSALPLLIVIALVFGGIARLLRQAPLRPQGASGESVRTLGRPAPIRIWQGVAVTALVLAVVLPIGVLIAKTGSTSTLFDATAAAGDEIVVSLVLGVVAAGVATLAALPMARWLDRRRFGWAWVLVFIPLAVPAPLLTMGLIRMWNVVPGDLVVGRLPMLLLAHVGRLLPFAVIVQVIQLRRVDRRLFEAAQLHDVGWARRLRSVYVPLMAPALIASLAVVFVLSLGELGASLLAVPPGTSTLPLRMFNLLHYGAGGEVAALALATVLFVSAVLAFASKAARR